MMKKEKGYWLQVLLLECEGKCNTFHNPVEPIDMTSYITPLEDGKLNLNALGAFLPSSPDTMDISSSLGQKWLDILCTTT